MPIWVWIVVVLILFTLVSDKSKPKVKKYVEGYQPGNGGEYAVDEEFKYKPKVDLTFDTRLNTFAQNQVEFDHKSNSDINYDNDGDESKFEPSEEAIADRAGQIELARPKDLNSSVYAIRGNVFEDARRQYRGNNYLDDVDVGYYGSSAGSAKYLGCVKGQHMNKVLGIAKPNNCKILAKSAGHSTFGMKGLRDGKTMCLASAESDMLFNSGGYGKCDQVGSKYLGRSDTTAIYGY